MAFEHTSRTPPEGGAQQEVLCVSDASFRLTPILIPDGSKMVFSVWCQSAATATITIIGGDTQEEVEVGTAWSRAVVVMENVQDVILTVPAGKTAYFYKAQLEYGTRVSDWTPAPEDTDAQIDNIHVGGRNLYTGTQYFDGDDWQDWSYNDWSKSSETYDGMTVMTRTGAWSGLTQPIAAQVGEEYTLSATVKAGAGATVMFYCENSNRNGTPIRGLDVNTWTRIHMTFTMLAAGEMTPRFENSVDGKSLSICGLKLELGNRATDWSPAPKDTETAIDQARGVADSAKSTAESTQVAFRRLINMEEDGLHIGDTQSNSEVVIDSESLNVVLGGLRYSKFAANYVQFGNYQLRRSSDGGLVFKLA